MASINRFALLFLAAIGLNSVAVSAQEASSGKHALHLSPQLMELLRAEMQALLSGVQLLSAGIATADWRGVADTSARISASYILEQKLTPGQREELANSLPEHFKMLDSNFHLEAKKLEAAAMRHDPQLSSFHYYRLIESCTVCHTIYAASAFPGFANADEGGHRH